MADPLLSDAPEDNVKDIERNEYQPQWDRSTRVIALVFLIIAGVYTFTLLAPVFLLLTLAFVFGFGMSKLCIFVNKNTPLNWGASVVVVYITVVTVLSFAGLSLVPPIVREVNNLIGNVETAYVQLQESAREYTPADGIVEILGVEVDVNFVLQPLINFIVEDETLEDTFLTEEESLNDLTETEIPPRATPIDPTAFDLRSIAESILSVAGQVTGVFTSVVGSIAGLFSNTLLALFVSFLVLIDLPNSRRILSHNIPPSYHREYAILFARLNRVWNGFFRGQVLIGIIIGLLTYIQLMIMGISGALVLALIVGFISLIPTIGGIIALVPVVIVPLLTGSTVWPETSNVTIAVLVVIVNLLISQVIWNTIAPIILGDALDLPLPVIVVGVFVGAAIGGVMGAFLIAPLVSSLRILFMYVAAKIGQRDPFPNDPHDLTLFKEAI